MGGVIMTLYWEKKWLRKWWYIYKKLYIYIYNFN